MSRNLPAAFSAALSDPNVAPILFFEGQFATGFVRFWTGTGTVEWSGREWTGGGNLLGISPMDEVSGVIASGAVVSLSGVPTSLVQVAIDEARQGMPGRAWFGLMNPDGSIIADPAQMFAGRMDVPNIEANGETVTITIAYENRLIDMDRPREFRYTDQSQKLNFPADRGFEFVTALQEAEIVWGRG
jgi:hypothetical protein